MDTQEKCKPAKLYFERYIPDFPYPNLPPIVFLHGLGGSHSSWFKVWTRIAEETRREAFTLDLRNHGKSEWNDVFAMDALLADLENFLIQKDIEKCILVSHSLGGRISMCLAMIKPKFVEKLVVEEAYLYIPPEEEVKPVTDLLAALIRLKFLPKNLSESELRRFIAKIAVEKFPQANFSDLAYYVPLHKEPDGGFSFDFNVDAAEKHLRNRSIYDIDFEKCQKFDGPALFVCAENSGIKVKEDSYIEEYFPNAEFCKLKTDQHTVHIQCPDEFIKEVVKFINN